MTRITVRGGKGGDGCFSFVQHRGSRGAFPAGGNGGTGGSVFIQTDPDMRSLFVQKKFLASNGQDGKSKDMNGKNGKDIVVKVPLGTVVREISPLQRKIVVANLDKQEKMLIASGGLGGRGNREYPSISKKEKGASGVFKKLELELKLIADIGLVGYPNAGKSSLLGSLSRACPKVASYPFTTLQPYIGVVEYIDGLTLTVADLPGLIEGAHANKGLGHNFLRHIQRTKGLLYVLDLSDQPLRQLYSLYEELKLYDKSLLARPFQIVLNKTDLQNGEDVQKYLLESFSTEVHRVSAKFGDGLDSLVLSLRNLVN